MKGGGKLRYNLVNRMGHCLKSESLPGTLLNCNALLHSIAFKIC